jgi:magnesium chelatase subunit D
MPSPSEPRRQIFPFAALVGQEDLRLCLLLAAVDPRLGGVLLRGEKGTAKSTAARGLSEIVGYDVPFVDLPLGATEDRVLGHLDLERAVREGEVGWTPGLLSRVHGGILYVDEANLLDDHLVETLLDVCASGVNRVERESLSFSHESSFVLVGSMNPEEGEIRPQMLDRFALSVQVESEKDEGLRMEVMRRRLAFEADRTTFRGVWESEMQKLRTRLRLAREILPAVVLPSALQDFVAEIAIENRVAGHRADLAIARASRALAAWEGRSLVESDDIARVAPFALRHRIRAEEEPQIPPPPPPPPKQEPEEDPPPPPEESDTPSEMPPPPESEASSESQESENDSDSQSVPPPEAVFATGEPFKVRPLDLPPDRLARSGSGRRSRSRSSTRQGRTVGSTLRRERDDLALDATLRAAAPHQRLRRQGSDSTLSILVEPCDVRERVRERKVSHLLLFVVDGSGSMGAHKRMVETKAAILSLLLDAYQKRDRVGMVVFRGQEAQTLLPPTPSVERAAKLLSELPAGGRTPLGAGLAEAGRILSVARRRDPQLRPLVLLLTDGRANAAYDGNCQKSPSHEAQDIACGLAERNPQARFIVVDTESQGRIRLGLAEKLAQALGGTCLCAGDLRAEDLVRWTRDALATSERNDS